jgi:hypothetical protein
MYRTAHNTAQFAQQPCQPTPPTARLFQRRFQSPILLYNLPAAATAVRTPNAHAPPQPSHPGRRLSVGGAGGGGPPLVRPSSSSRPDRPVPVRHLHARLGALCSVLHVEPLGGQRSLDRVWTGKRAGARRADADHCGRVQNAGAACEAAP